VLCESADGGVERIVHIAVQTSHANNISKTTVPTMNAHLVCALAAVNPDRLESFISVDNTLRRRSPGSCTLAGRRYGSYLGDRLRLVRVPPVLLESPFVLDGLALDALPRLPDAAADLPDGAVLAPGWRGAARVERWVWRRVSSATSWPSPVAVFSPSISGVSTAWRAIRTASSVVWISLVGVTTSISGVWTV
jgi:hypothetical protein